MKEKNQNKNGKLSKAMEVILDYTEQFVRNEYNIWALILWLRLQTPSIAATCPGLNAYGLKWNLLCRNLHNLQHRLCHLHHHYIIYIIFIIFYIQLLFSVHARRKRRETPEYKSRLVPEFLIHLCLPNLSIKKKSGRRRSNKNKTYRIEFME